MENLRDEGDTIHDRVGDKERQYTKRQESKAADVDQASRIAYIAVPVFVVWVWIVEIVVLFHILGE